MKLDRHQCTIMKVWAKGKEFRVGDKLVFKYTIGLHNLYQVNEDAYKNCIIPQYGDTIVLESLGPEYFVCGVGLHCKKGGQRLSINVKQRDTQGPIQGAKTPSKSPVVAPSQSPTTNALPNAPPCQSSDTNGPPYAQPFNNVLVLCFYVTVNQIFRNEI
ncbi:hypothetical protein HYC85_025447 [Camellia sinensis]|uniref:Phytocyanin domain-containing protein n=1 Tax=Camellia sinensis TaxID=4442 RepID=A0A7J7GDB3_CAMSI|nr:hypothetical protein HYC85_025447 [Camellia sinensis]